MLRDLTADLLPFVPATFGGISGHIYAEGAVLRSQTVGNQKIPNRAIERWRFLKLL